MKSSAIPAVGDCGFFSSFLGGGGECGVLFVGVGEVLKVEKVWEKEDKSFKKESICSEFFNFSINGFTLSEKSGFCER